MDRFKFRGVWKPCEGVAILHEFNLGEDNFNEHSHSECWTLLIRHAECIEQCTGLKDKNGKLIWEGDIVTYGGCEQWKTVVSRAGDGAFVTRPRIVSKCRTLKDLLGFSVQAFERQTVEIIGNIHTHPELLEA
jgi:uncharacterized phage protein (TIGR01671 family)